MARKSSLTEEQWADMLNRYQMGDSIRDISRDYNYDSGNLTRRFQKSGAVQGELQQVIKKQFKKAVEQATAITPEIQQITAEIQHEGIKRILDKRGEQLAIVNEVTDIALKLHRNLLAEVSNLANPVNRDKGGYKPHEAAAILRSLGMSYDKLLEQMGISGEDHKNPDNPDSSENGIVTVRLVGDG